MTKPTDLVAGLGVRVGLGGLEPPASSLSGMIGHRRYVLRPMSAGLSACPRVTVTNPDRPPDRARVGHDHVIRSHGQTVQTCPGVAACWGDVPGLSFRVGSWLRSWQQVRQQPRTGVADRGADPPLASFRTCSLDGSQSADPGLQISGMRSLGERPSWWTSPAPCRSRRSSLVSCGLSRSAA
jgi:hypothetical protein